MSHSLHGGVFPTGLATGIGSLPFTDARDAAKLVLRTHPDLPAIPQLARAHEGVVAQWANALPEVTIAPDGSLIIDEDRVGEPLDVSFTPESPAGLLGFLDVARPEPKPNLRVQA